MIPSGTRFVRPTFSFAALLSHLFVSPFLAAYLAPSASAQSQTYPINASLAWASAGSFGTTLFATATDPSTTANFQVCFDTGYGGSTLPIAPNNFRDLGRAFTSGSLTVSSHSVSTTFTHCSGDERGAAQGDPVTPGAFKDGTKTLGAGSLVLEKPATFAPATAQQFSKSITNDVQPGGVTLSPGNLQFGNVTFGASANRTVTITNARTTAITSIGVSSTAYPNPNDFVPTLNCPRRWLRMRPARSASPSSPMASDRRAASSMSSLAQGCWRFQSRARVREVCSR